MHDQTGGAARELRACFVIGPIGNRHAEHGTEERRLYEEALQTFAELIEPACKKFGLQPVRADGLGRAGELTEQIFRRLREDDIVIADLTGANANVMYELGMRHTRDKLTLQVGEYGRLPFDVNVIKTVMFSRSEHSFVTARKDLETLLEAGLAGEWDPVTATRVWLQGGATDPAVEFDVVERPTRQEPSAAAVDDDDQPGFVDLLAAAEEAQDALHEATDEVNADLQRMGALSNESAAKVTDADAKGRGMKARLVILTTYAQALDEIAADLESHVREYSEALNAVSGGYSALIARIEEDPESLNEPEAMEFAQTARGLAATARDSVSELGGLVNALNENAKFARALRPPSRRVAAALQAFASTTQVFDELDRRLQNLGVPLRRPDDDTDPDGDEAPENADPPAVVLDTQPPATDRSAQPPA